MNNFLGRLRLVRAERVTTLLAGPFHVPLDHTSCMGRKKAASLQLSSDAAPAHCWAVGRRGGNSSAHMAMLPQLR